MPSGVARQLCLADAGAATGPPIHHHTPRARGQTDELAKLEAAVKTDWRLVTRHEPW
jgi:hypothetical protein